MTSSYSANKLLAGHLKSPNAKAAIKDYASKSETTAMTSKTPAGKQKLAAKIKVASKTKSKLTSPGELARCVAIVGGDLYAAALLYRVQYLWKAINPKLHRHGKEWLAMRIEEWGLSAGLSKSQMDKYALPRLRRNCASFIEIRAMDRGPKKKLGISLDVYALAEAGGAVADEMQVLAQEGLDPFEQNVVLFPAQKAP